MSKRKPRRRPSPSEAPSEPLASPEAGGPEQEADHPGDEALPVEHWVEQLRSPRREERGVAAIQLGHKGLAALEAVPALLDAVRAESDMAGWALLQIVSGPVAAPAIPALRAALDDDYDVVRMYAAWLLGQIGPAARETLPALHRAEDDSSPRVREKVREAIALIEGQAQPVVPTETPAAEGETPAGEDEDADHLAEEGEDEEEEPGPDDRYPFFLLGEDKPASPPPIPKLPEEGLLATLAGEGEAVHVLRFSADGRSLVAVGDRVLVWDLAARSYRVALGPFARSWEAAQALSPDLRWLALANQQGDVSVWDLETATERHRWPGSDAIQAAWETASEDQKQQWWDQLPAQGLIHRLVFTPDGSRLIVCGIGYLPRQGSSGAVKLWNVADGALEVAILADPQAVTCAAFSADGRWLATLGERDGVKLWELRPKVRRVESELPRHGFPGKRDAAFSPDGRLLAISTFGGLQIWQRATGRQKAEFKAPWADTRDIAFSPDGAWVAAVDRPARLWEVRGSRLAGLLYGLDRGVTALAFSPDGALAACGDHNGTVRLWDLRRALADPAAVARRIAEVAAAVREQPWGHGSSAAWEALRWCEDALLLDPNGWLGHHVQGLALRDEGKREEAVAAFRTALRLDPQRIESHKQYAIALALLGRHAEALAAARAILRRQPNDPAGYALRADVAAHQGDFSRAIADYDAALERTGQGDVGLLLRRGLARARIGRVAEALADLNAAVSLAPDDSRLRRHRAELHALRGDLAPGIADLTSVLGQDSREQQALLRRGQLRAAAGQWQAALEDFQEILQGYGGPRTAALVGQGEVLAMLGSFPEAIASLSQALERRRRDPHARLLRALCYLAEGEPLLAAEDVGEAPRLDPRYAALPDRLKQSPESFAGAAAEFPDLQRLAVLSLEAAARQPPRPADPTEAVRTLDGHSDLVTGVAFARDGTLALSASADGAVVLWEVETGREVGRLAAHRGGVTAMAVFPDGSHLVTGGRDGVLRLWKVGTARAVRVIRGSGEVACLAVTPDGQQVLTGGRDGTIRCWDGSTGRQEWVYEGEESVESLAADPRGRLLLFGAGGEGEGGVGVLRVKDGRLEGWLQGHTPHRDDVSAVAFTPDGDKAVSAGGGGLDIWGEQIDTEVRLWDLASGEPRVFTREHQAAVLALAVSPDGRRLLSGDAGGALLLWDLAGGRCLHRLGGHPEGVWCLAWSPDGRLVLSGGRDHRVRLWGPANQRQ